MKQISGCGPYVCRVLKGQLKKVLSIILAVKFKCDFCLNKTTRESYFLWYSSSCMYGIAM